MSDRHPIRNGIISTVVGGVVLWVLGLVWPPLWNILGVSVRVPLWVIAIAAIGVLVLVRTLCRPTQLSLSLPRSGATDLSAPPLLPQAAIDPLERKIFTRLVEADGASVSFNALLRATSSSRLRLQAELERLDTNELVDISDDPSEGNADVYLTQRGRQYLVQLGLL